MSFFSGKHAHALDKFVGKQFSADSFHLFAGKSVSVDEIFGAGGDKFVFFEFASEDIGGGGTESTRNVIGHTGTETHDNDIVTGGKFHKVGRPGRTDLPALKNRIIKQICQFFSFAGSDVCRDGINVTDADFADLWSDLQLLTGAVLHGLSEVRCFS